MALSCGDVCVLGHCRQGADLVLGSHRNATTLWVNGDGLDLAEAFRLSTLVTIGCFHQ